MNTTIEKQYFNTFLSNGTSKIIQKGTFLFDFNNPKQSVYCVEEGLCALVSFTQSGEEKIYLYFTAGSIINFTPAYLSLPHDSNTTGFLICTKTTCRVTEVSYPTFYNLIDNDANLNRFIMSCFANHLTSVLYHFHFMLESTVTCRLCKTLIDLSYISGNKRMLHKHFNYVELGKYLGVHTITVSRIMSALKQQGIIEKSGHTIILKDINSLTQYVNNKKLLSY
ncbi:MAG: Crp/Fnr family transcriptional regulator [Cellulosilyticaceae bacterium]